jgi:hypothetical protein
MPMVVGEAHASCVASRRADRQLHQLGRSRLKHSCGARHPALITGGWHSCRQQLPAGPQHRHPIDLHARIMHVCPAMSACGRRMAHTQARPLTVQHTQHVCSMPNHQWGCKQSGARLMAWAATCRKKLHGTERAPQRQHEHMKNMGADIISPEARRPSIAPRRQQRHGQST